MSPLLRFVVAFGVFAVAGNVVTVALAVATGQSLGLPSLLHLVFSSLAMGGHIWLTMRWVRRGGRINEWC